MLPALKILVIFALIIIMLHRKVDLGATLLIASFALGLFFGLNALTVTQKVALSLLESTTVTLIVVLVLIIIMESIMRQTGMLQTITNSLSRLSWNHCLIIAALPAIIGLLPSVGGARFSAPLVDQAVNGKPFTTDEKVFINFWFRHIWEYTLPLYPGLILAATISGIPLGDIILLLWPVSVIWALIGYKFAFKEYRCRIRLTGQSVTPGKASSHLTSDHQPPVKETLKTFLLSTWPIWITVILVLFQVPIAWALGVVLMVLIVLRRYPLRNIGHTLTEPMTRRIVFLTWGIMAFKEVLQYSAAAEQLSSTIAAYNIPAVLIAVTLPVAIGLLTGVVQACIGISFPMLVGLVEPSGAYVMLAYAAGVIGVMLSPVHLCLILTIDYFRAYFVSAYKRLILPNMLVLVASLVLYELIAYCS